MPLSVYVKKKDIKSRCRAFVGKSSKDNKKCLELTMDCHMNKCKKEVDNKISAELIDEDYKKCLEESKGDFKKLDKCHIKILKKNDFYEKYAKMGHCTANKCPEMTKFNGETMHVFFKKIMNGNRSPKCILDKCKKENNELDKNNFDKIEATCNKKYEKYKDYLKCFKHMSKSYKKSVSKYHNCKDTKCNIDNKQNTKKTLTKKSASHTKKSKV